MAASTMESSIDLFRTYTVDFDPLTDIICINSLWYSQWGSDLSPGVVHTIDPNGNVLTIEVSPPVPVPYFVTGGLKMARFYGLKYDRILALRYVGNNKFHIRLYDLGYEEICYPIVSDVAKPEQFLASKDFFRTLKTLINPNEELMRLPHAFNYFWYGEVSNGEVKFTDPVGNSHCVLLSEELYLKKISYGVCKMAEFYELKHEHHVWVHYLGDNEFRFRIFAMNNTKIFYPLFDENSVVPMEDEVVVPKDVQVYLNENDVINVDDDADIVLNGNDNVVVVENDNNEVDVDPLEDDTEDDEYDDEELENRSWVKEVTGADLKGGQTLVIPSRIVRHLELHKKTHIWLKPRVGESVKCRLMGGKRRKFECYIGPGWYEFVAASDIDYDTFFILWFDRDDHDILNVAVA